MARQPRRLLVVLGLVLLLVLAAAPTLAQLELPKPSGRFAVGREHLVISDPTRDESLTAAPTDRRQVPVTLWFPATAGTGEPAPYVDRLAALSEGLAAGGDLNAATVAGLRLIRDHARIGAAISRDRRSYPLVLLSPGNATNVAFYATLAEQLASHGFVVAGVDHPFQSAAVLLEGGAVAVYEGDPPQEEAAAVATARIADRVLDLRLVLDGMATRGATLLDGRIDLASVGVMGHSNGGLAAVQVCRDDPRIDACMNIDGQQNSGPFPVDAPPTAPPKPFLFLTKETDLHAVLRQAFDEGGRAGHGTYRVVVPAASHQQFADGPMFEPTLNPLPGVARKVTTLSRGFALAFFEVHLRAAPLSLFNDVAASSDLVVEVHSYPDG